MTRYIYYYYTNGTLVFNYRDDNAKITMRYIDYPFKEALQKFRQKTGLRHKHITIKKLGDLRNER